MTAAFPLINNIEGLKTGSFDVLVVGGGIYGAWTAYDAALRGLKVALIEKKDWGCGTSQSSSKLIHGGLRYLEHYEFKLVSHALVERRVLSDIAPHLVRPLNFMVPVWKNSRVGRMQLLAGLTLYDFLATGKQPVPRHKSFSADVVRREHPYLLSEGLKGGLRYGDCQEDDARMTMVVVAAAQSRDVVCASGVSADSLIVEGGRVLGVVASNDGSAPFEIRARYTVNAAGPWALSLTQAALGAAAPAVKLVKGVHLVMPHIPGLEVAFLLTSPADGRVFFVIPWYDRTLVGTTEASITDASQSVVTAEETRYLLASVARLMPGLNWTETDVIASYAGARTLQAEDAETLAAQTREFVITEPAPGLVWPIGGKYTTARCDSALVVNQLMSLLGRDPGDSLTHRYPLPGAPVGTREGSVMLGDFTSWQSEAIAGLVRRGLSQGTAGHLTRRHGTRIARIHQLLHENESWSALILPDAAFIEAEVILAMRDEGARTLEDVTRRRMPLTLLARPGPWQERVAELMKLA